MKQILEFLKRSLMRLIITCIHFVGKRSPRVRLWVVIHINRRLLRKTRDFILDYFESYHRTMDSGSRIQYAEIFGNEDISEIDRFNFYFGQSTGLYLGCILFDAGTELSFIEAFLHNMNAEFHHQLDGYVLTAKDYDMVTYLDGDSNLIVYGLDRIDAHGTKIFATSEDLKDQGGKKDAV